MLGCLLVLVSTWRSLQEFSRKTNFKERSKLRKEKNLRAFEICTKCSSRKKDAELLGTCRPQPNQKQTARLFAQSVGPIRLFLASNTMNFLSPQVHLRLVFWTIAKMIVVTQRDIFWS